MGYTLFGELRQYLARAIEICLPYHVDANLTETQAANPVHQRQNLQQTANQIMLNDGLSQNQLQYYVSNRDQYLRQLIQQPNDADHIYYYSLNQRPSFSFNPIRRVPQVNQAIKTDQKQDSQGIYCNQIITLLSEELNNSNNQMNDLKHQNINLTSKKHSHKARQILLVQNQKKLKLQRLQLKEEIEKLHLSNTQKQNQLNNKSKTIQQLTNKILKQNQQIQNVINSLRTKLTESQKQKQNLTFKVKQYEDRDFDYGVINFENYTLKKQQKQLYSYCRSQFNKYETKIQQYVANVQNKQSQIILLQKKLASQKKNVCNLNDQIKRYAADDNILSFKYNCIKQQASNNQKKYLSQIKQLQEHVKNVQAVKKGQIQRLFQQLDQAQKQRKVFLQLFADNQKLKQKYMQQCQKSKIQLNCFKNQTETNLKISKIESQHQKQIKALSYQINAVRKINQKKSEDQINQLQSSLQIIKNQIIKLRRQVQTNNKGYWLIRVQQIEQDQDIYDDLDLFSINQSKISCILQESKFMSEYDRILQYLQQEDSQLKISRSFQHQPSQEIVFKKRIKAILPVVESQLLNQEEGQNYRYKYFDLKLIQDQQSAKYKIEQDHCQSQKQKDCLIFMKTFIETQNRESILVFNPQNQTNTNFLLFQLQSLGDQFKLIRKRHQQNTWGVNKLARQLWECYCTEVVSQDEDRPESKWIGGLLASLPFQLQNKYLT